MILYHGTSTSNALSIMKNGFDFLKAGSNWGKTYGKGIYFSPNYETARFYAGEDGIVLKFDIKINPLQLTKDYSPNSKKKLQIPKEINCLINKNHDEYIILYFI
jgi:hypothetical protein